MPSECLVPNSGSFGRITFKLLNVSAELLVFDRCNRIPTLYSCADDYTAKVEYVPQMFTIPCAEPKTYCNGGGCENLPESVPAGESVVLEWPGEVFTYGSTPMPNACKCYVPHVAPSGRYRATLTVYRQTSTYDIDTSSARTLTADFVLPDDDGVVTFTVP
jgi:hypothetical protein